MIQSALTKIQALRKECRDRASKITRIDGLIFLISPQSASLSTAPRGGLSGLNDGKHALDPNQAVNKDYLKHELWLLSALEELDAVSSHSEEVVREHRRKAVKSIQSELDRLELLKAEEWTRQEASQSRTRALAHASGVEVIDTGKAISVPQIYSLTMHSR